MDLYEVLGVRRAATAADVRRAWQRKSRALHPALNPGDPVAAERYREVAHAWEVLSDAKRRAAYDRGEEEPAPVEPTPEGGFEGFDFSVRVRTEKVSFREIFRPALRPPEDSPDALRGEDLEQATRNELDRTARSLTSIADRQKIGVTVGEVSQDTLPVTLIKSSDQEKFIKLIKEYFPKLDLKGPKQLNGGQSYTLNLKPQEIAAFKDDTLRRSLEILRNRIDQFGVTEPTIVPQGDDQIVVQLPGIQDPSRARQLIKQTAQLSTKG